MHICNSKSTTELYGWKIHSPSPWFLLIHQFFSRLYPLCYPDPDWSPPFFPQPQSLWWPFFFHFLTSLPLPSLQSVLAHSLCIFVLLMEIATAPAPCSQSPMQSHLSLVRKAVSRCYSDIHSSSTIFQHSLGEHFPNIKVACHWKRLPQVVISSQSQSFEEGRQEMLSVRRWGENGLKSHWGSSLIRI